MKVLVVASKYLPEYTGAAFRIHNLYKHLKTQGVDVEVLCGGIEKMDAERYVLDGIPVERLACHWPSQKGRIADAVHFWRDALAGFLTLNRKNFDVLHVVGTSPLTAAAKHYASLKGCPILVEMVTTGSSVSQGVPGLGRLWAPRLHRRSAIVAISPSLAEKAMREGYRDNVWARPNPVDTDRFFFAPNTKAARPYAPDDIVLLMVAKFMAQKNQAFLPSIMARLPERFKLVLAGPLAETGPLAAKDRAYFEKLKNDVDSMGLSGRIHILPGFADAAAYMKTADLYLMPNTAEALGTPMLEALACGVPVIANAGEAAFRDMQSRMPDGAVVLMPLDAQAWADAIVKANPVPRADYADFIAGRYAFVATANQYKALLKALTFAARADHINVQSVLSAGKTDAS